MASNYQELLNNLHEKPPRKLNDHILVIDSLNTFIRSFSMLKAMNPKGQHIGGLVGFLRSLGFLVRTIDPTRVICVFDGKGSSINRRNIDPNYKANRDNLKVTHWGMFDTREEERESMSAQISRLLDYLDCLPISLVSLDKVEADDIISFIAKGFSRNNSKTTIVSSDKDFLQIIDNNIEVHAPVKKKTFDINNIREEIKVIPENFLIVKALIGDNSDNLRGIKGAGIKTLIKIFPDLVSKPLELDDIFSIAENNLNDRKIFARIIHEWDLVERNYELMNIQEPNLSDNEKNHIINVLKEPPNKLQSGTFLHYLEQDSIEGITKNTEGWLETFRELTLVT